MLIITSLTLLLGTGGLTAVPENEGDLEVTEVDGDGFNEFNQGDGQSVGGNTAISSIGGDDFPPEGQGQSLDGSQIGGGGGRRFSHFR